MIALARTYRPKRFAELIVQDHVAAALRGAVEQGRPAHGYLFAGPRGTGKTTAARILAMALNCERRGAPEVPAGEPCGSCESCTRVWTGAANLDVVELDAASNRGVDDARELRERAMYAASASGRHKVYIVDEAHMLTREAWNALLKILEEPPPGVVFVFATTEPQKIQQSAAPVLSRLQRFDFRRIGPHAIAARLAEVCAGEQLTVADDALALIARSADGGMRDGLSLLDQVLAFGAGPVTAQRVRDVLGLIPDDVYGEVLRAVVERDSAAVFPLMDRLIEGGADLQEFVRGVGDVLRAVLLAGMGGRVEGLTEALAAVVQRAAAGLPPEDVVRLLALLTAAEPLIRQSGQPRLAVEVLLLRWTMMERTVALESVIRALSDASGSGGGGPVEPARPAARRDPPQLRDGGAGATGRPRASADAASPVGRAPTAPAAVAAPAAGALPEAPVAVERGPLTLERLQAIWPRVVAAARAASPMLSTLLAATEVVAVVGEAVTIRATDAHPGHVEGLAHKRDAVGKAIGAWVEEPVRVVMAAPTEGMAKPVRLTQAAAAAERLQRLRGQDAALNAAVDALDLELLE